MVYNYTVWLLNWVTKTSDFDKAYDIIEACNGKEVLHYLEEAKRIGIFPCLIVLDLNMLVLSDKQTLSRKKQVTTLNSIPAVVLTTSSSH